MLSERGNLCLFIISKLLLTFNLGLKTSGVKSNLISRLKEYIDNQEKVILVQTTNINEEEENKMVKEKEDPSEQITVNNDDDSSIQGFYNLLIYYLKNIYTSKSYTYLCRI